MALNRFEKRAGEIGSLNSNISALIVEMKTTVSDLRVLAQKDDPWTEADPIVAGVTDLHASFLKTSKEVYRLYQAGGSQNHSVIANTSPLKTRTQTLLSYTKTRVLLSKSGESENLPEQGKIQF